MIATTYSLLASGAVSEFSDDPADADSCRSRVPKSPVVVSSLPTSSLFQEIQRALHRPMLAPVVWLDTLAALPMDWAWLRIRLGTG